MSTSSVANDVIQSPTFGFRLTTTSFDLVLIKCDSTGSPNVCMDEIYRTALLLFSGACQRRENHPLSNSAPGKANLGRITVHQHRIFSTKISAQEIHTSSKTSHCASACHGTAQTYRSTVIHRVVRRANLIGSPKL